jgi:hypothetical protein
MPFFVGYKKGMNCSGKRGRKKYFKIKIKLKENDKYISKTCQVGKTTGCR